MCRMSDKRQVKQVWDAKVQNQRGRKYGTRSSRNPQQQENKMERSKKQNQEQERMDQICA